MSILVSVAHAASPAAPGFDKDFFDTAATVIPVLFLAIAVQGPAYDNVLGAAQKAGKRKGFFAKIRGFYAATFLLAIAYLILVATAIGEIYALYALYQGRSNDGTKQVVFTTILILLATACAGPALSLARGYGRSWRGLPWESLFTLWLKAAKLAERPVAVQPVAGDLIGKFVLKKDLSGKYQFNLLAADGQVIATSEAYERKQSALDRIELMKKDAPGAEVDDKTGE